LEAWKPGSAANKGQVGNFPWASAAVFYLHFNNLINQLRMSIPRVAQHQLLYPLNYRRFECHIILFTTYERYEVPHGLGRARGWQLPRRKFVCLESRGLVNWTFLVQQKSACCSVWGLPCNGSWNTRANRDTAAMQDVVGLNAS
jgi:hypothetical protein